MSQIIKKFIGAFQVDETKIRLSNDAFMVGRNNADSADIDILKVNASDQVEFAAAISMGSNKIENLADPTNAQDAATKNYVDSLPSGANTTLSNLVSPTAVNQDLLAGTNLTQSVGAIGSAFLDGYFGTVHNAGVRVYTNGGFGTEGLRIQSNSINQQQTTIGLTVATASASATNGSGALTLTTGSVADGTSGDIAITCGAPSGTGSRGNVVIDCVNAQLRDEAQLRFYDSGNANYLGFKSPATLSGSVDFVLPDGDGTNGQMLTTDGSGNLSWSSAAASIQYRKEQITLSGTDITNQYVTLANVPQANSVMLFAGGLAQVEDADWEIDGSNADQLNFLGDLATGGAAELVAGDIIHVTYAYT